MDDRFKNYSKEALIEDVICDNCSLVHSESKKSSFALWRNLKEPPSVLKILPQIGTYDMTTFQAIKNEYKVAIPSEYFIKKPLGNDNIPYTVVSLIRDFGHYVSDVFDFNTGLWWHCDDANITEVSNFIEGVYTREIHKPNKTRKLVSGSKDILFVVYIRIEDLIASGSVFKRIQ